jgi:hypothetical protein
MSFDSVYDDTRLGTKIKALNIAPLSPADSGKAIVWDGSKWIASTVGGGGRVIYTCIITADPTPTRYFRLNNSTSDPNPINEQRNQCRIYKNSILRRLRAFVWSNNFTTNLHFRVNGATVATIPLTNVGEVDSGELNIPINANSLVNFMLTLTTGSSSEAIAQVDIE